MHGKHPSIRLKFSRIAWAKRIGQSSVPKRYGASSRKTGATALTCRKTLRRNVFSLRISNFGWSIASIFYSGLVHYIKHCCLIGLCVIPFFATKHQPKCFSTLVDLSNSSILMAGKSSNFAVYVWTNLDIKIFIMIVNVLNSTNVGSSSQVHTCMHLYIHACLHAYIYGYIMLHTITYLIMPTPAVWLFVCLFACLFFCLLHGWLVYTRCLWTCIWWFLLKVYCSILLRTPADIWGSFVVMMAPCWKRWWTMRCSQLEDISSWPHLNWSMVF